MAEVSNGLVLRCRHPDSETLEKRLWFQKGICRPLSGQKTDDAQQIIGKAE